MDQGKGLRRVGQGRGGWVEIRVDQTRVFLLKNMTLLFCVLFSGHDKHRINITL